jgi:hypothetical protein
VRRRVRQGDCPTEPAHSVEILEETILELAHRAALLARLRSPSEIPEAPCPKCAQREARMFPIMDGPDVPWSLLEPHEKYAMKNHGQTLERLAERGGLAAVEALQILDAKPFGSVKLTVDYANRILAARVRSLRSSDSSRSDTETPNG